MTTDLATRLVRGQVWLMQHCDPESSQADFDRWLAQLDKWDRLARWLDANGYRECIHGAGNACPPDAPVECLVCGNAKRTE